MLLLLPLSPARSGALQDLQVTAEAAVVTLDEVVGTERARARAVRIASRTRGVDRVEDRLKVGATALPTAGNTEDSGGGYGPFTSSFGSMPTGSKGGLPTFTNSLAPAAAGPPISSRAISLRATAAIAVTTSGVKIVPGSALPRHLSIAAGRSAPASPER